jgi:hypothetical protein
MEILNMGNIELNITMQCNVGCANCNRFCHIYKDRTEHMTVAQIEKFLHQAKQGGGVGKVKVVGGEPFMHPDFVGIYNALVKGSEEKAIAFFKVDTNKTLPYPKVTPSPYARFSGKHPTRKAHLPIMWSPADMGIVTKGPCQQIRKCGYSLDKYGYLPCSLAIIMVRLFDLTHLYRHELPKEPWGLDELCPKCIFSMDADWRHKFTKPLKLITEEERTPSKSYAEAMAKFDVEKFYRTQKEF